MNKASENRLLTLDVMRGLASLGVVLCHYGGLGYLFPQDHFLTSILYNGTYGVQFFFVISGFIIPYSLFRNNYKISSFFKFILRRSIRIDPPYYLTVVLMVLLDYLISLYSSLPFSFNIYQFLAHLFYLIPFTDLNFYDPLFWTLAIEFQYYIFIGITFPLLLNNRIIFTHTFLLFFIFATLIDYHQRFFILNYGAIFSVGIILFLHKIQKIRQNVLYFYFIISCIVIYFSFELPVLISVSLSFFAIHYWKVENKILNFLGKISYSLYLIHNIPRTILFSNFSANLLKIHNVGLVIQFFYLVIFVSIAILSATVYYYLIEKPSLTFSKKVAL